MKKLLLGLSVALMLSACSTPRINFDNMTEQELVSYNASASFLNKVRCVNDVRVGSHIRKRTCKQYRETLAGHIGTLDVAGSSASYILSQ